MTSIRCLKSIAAAGLMISLSGCLFSYSHERVLREEEPVRSARFESPEARHAFDMRAMSDAERQKSDRSNSLNVPFLLGLKYKRSLSQNAFYNDQLTLCDSNNDGLITLAEAEAYNPSAITPPLYPATQPAVAATPMARPPMAQPPITQRPMAQPASVQSPHTDIRFVR